MSGGSRASEGDDCGGAVAAGKAWYAGARAGGFNGGEGTGMGGAGEPGSADSFLERLRDERGLSEALARLMTARVALPEFLREPGERWMR